MRRTSEAWPRWIDDALSRLAEAESESGSPLTGTSTAGSFWLVPSLLIAVVIIVGLIARQRERARHGIRDL